LHELVAIKYSHVAVRLCKHDSIYYSANYCWLVSFEKCPRHNRIASVVMHCFLYLGDAVRSLFYLFLSLCELTRSNNTRMHCVPVASESTARDKTAASVPV